MTLKNKLQSRIRGWFPTDPTIRPEIQTRTSVRKASPSLNDRLVGGLGAAGGTFTLSAIIFSFVPEYPKQIAELMLFVGIPLLVAAFLVSIIGKRRTQGRNN